ncbi:MAG: helix-turn-helix transcriptional regulator [Gemmataceae bacterium]
MGEQTFLTDAELRRRYGGLHPRTTMRWRSDGTGPRYTRVGSRILYCLDDVLKWEGANAFAHRAAEAVARARTEAPIAAPAQTNPQSAD